MLTRTFFILLTTTLSVINAAHIPPLLLERNLLMLGILQQRLIEQLGSAHIAAACHPHKNLIAIAYAEERPLEIYSIQPYGQLVPLQVLSDHDELSQQSVCARWNYSGEYLAVGNFGQPNAIYQLDKDSNQLTFLCHTTRNDHTSTIAWSIFGTFLYSANVNEYSYIDSFNPHLGILIESETTLVPTNHTPILVGWGKSGTHDGFCIRDTHGESYIVTDLCTHPHGCTIEPIPIKAFTLYKLPKKPRIRIDCPETESIDGGDGTDGIKGTEALVEALLQDEAAEVEKFDLPEEEESAVMLWLSHLTMPSAGDPIKQAAEKEITESLAHQDLHARKLFELAQTPPPTLEACCHQLLIAIRQTGWSNMYRQGFQGNTPLHLTVMSSNIYFLLSVIVASPSVYQVKALLKRRNNFHQTPYTMATLLKKTLPGGIVYRIILELFRTVESDTSKKEFLGKCKEVIERHVGTRTLAREIEHLIEYM